MIDDLTPVLRETVEALAARDKGDKLLARQLGIPVKTLQGRLSRIYRHWNVRNRREAIQYYHSRYGGATRNYSAGHRSILRYLPRSDSSIDDQFALRDHIGIWCAECLQYIHPGSSAASYYQFGQLISDYYLGMHASGLTEVLGLAVPIHRDSCFSGLGTQTAPAASMASWPTWQTWELENLANVTFYRGNLNFNIAVRILLSRRRTSEGNDEGAAFETARATVSNGGSIRSEVISPILAPCIPDVIERIPDAWIRFLLGVGNRVRNTGHPDHAEQTYDLAQGRILKLREKSPHARSVDAFERRIITVAKHVTMNNIGRVIDNAEDHNERYGLLTAHHNAGWLHLRDSEYVRAERCFEQMLSRGDEPFSWWHRMAGWLGLGATLYMADQQNYEKAIRYCLMAEYVSAMLGLRVDVTRGVSEMMLPKEVLLSPSAIVRTIGIARNISRDRMEALRQQAIIETGLQLALVEEISARPYEKRPR